MIGAARIDGGYSRAERLSDAAVHVTGMAAAFVAAPVLVTLAALRIDDIGLVMAAAVYGLSLIGMLCCSALYHMARAPEWKDALRRLDQSAIYVKIAGAYTPFAVLAGSGGMPFLAGLWAVALAGVSLKMLTARRLFGVTVALYLAMGWAAAVLGGPIIDRMTPDVFRLVLIGGGLYTTGVLFLVWERLPFHTTIWHVFVLMASFLLYAAIFIEFYGIVAV